jgi:hypothetical protein
MGHPNTSGDLENDILVESPSQATSGFEAIEDALRRLTGIQVEVVTAPVESRVLVIAPAGSGKTRMVAERLRYLVDKGAVAPGEGLLVLSFSRAAVNEVRDRLKSVPGAARLACPTTFDSYATQLLSLFSEDDSWQTKDYDGRVEEATMLLERARDKPGGLADAIGALRHVIVDELQDLVGCRAEFVLALLRVCGGGFTVLGDPAQSIYEFQLRGQERRTSSAEFLGLLREQTGAQLECYELTRNFRARTERAKAAFSFGAKLSAAGADNLQIRGELERVLDETLQFTPDLLEARVKLGQSSAGLLCRFNGQALQISRELQTRGIPHTLRRGASEKAASRWIADAFAGLDVGQVGRTRFEELLGVLPAEARPETADAWVLLKSLDRGGRRQLDLGEVAARIRCRAFPEILNDVTAGNLIVSTIHRAKGLEFDEVYVVWNHSSVDRMNAEELAEDTRVLYVALTRPRTMLARLNMSRSEGMFTCKGNIDRRWTLRPFTAGGRAGRGLLGLELRGDDVDPDCPGGTFPLAEFAAPDLQAYLRARVCPGDPVTLELCRATREGRPRVIYRIAHQGSTIGATTQRFGEILATLAGVGGPDHKFPARITGARVDMLETVSGSQGTAAQVGLGQVDLWLRPRVSGLGMLDWSGGHGNGG